MPSPTLELNRIVSSNSKEQKHDTVPSQPARAGQGTAGPCGRILCQAGRRYAGLGQRLLSLAVIDLNFSSICGQKPVYRQVILPCDLPCVDLKEQCNGEMPLLPYLAHLLKPLELKRPAMAVGNPVTLVTLVDGYRAGESWQMLFSLPDRVGRPPHSACFSVFCSCW
jgi:hypothetical protein